MYIKWYTADDTKSIRPHCVFVNTEEIQDLIDKDVIVKANDIYDYVIELVRQDFLDKVSFTIDRSEISKKVVTPLLEENPHLLVGLTKKEND